MRYDVVTIVAAPRGASQLRELVSQLPAEFGIPVVCLAVGDQRFVADLAASTRLQVKWAEAGEELLPGHVYVSPPGASIVIRDDRRVSLTPFSPDSAALRPVDSFLASVGRAYADRALGIVLAAFPDDGAEGAHSLKWRGGTVLVLDRATAEYYGMADAIVKAGSYDRILSAGEVANALRSTFTGRDLLASAELQFQLGVLLDSALRISGTHMGNMQLAEPVTERLHIVAHRGLDQRFLDRFGVVRVDDESACARALRLRQRVIIEDVFDDRDYAPYLDVARETGYRAVQSTPIVGDEGVAGVFSTLYPFKHRLTEHEARNLDDIAVAARELVQQVR
jgi:two-component system chemotaxis response regulator CheB